jgi:hypothetical protein
MAVNVELIRLQSSSRMGATGIEADGVFCYTFFKAVGRRPGPEIPMDRTSSRY